MVGKCLLSDGVGRPSGTYSAIPSFYRNAKDEPTQILAKQNNTQKYIGAKCAQNKVQRTNKMFFCLNETKLDCAALQLNRIELTTVAANGGGSS